MAMEPQINLYVERIATTNRRIEDIVKINSQVTCSYLNRTYGQSGPNQSHGIAINGKPAFLSSIGKQNLQHLGLKDGDRILIEECSDSLKLSPTSKQSDQKPKAKNKSKSRKKKKKIKANPKRTPQQPIIVPQTEEDDRKEHSKKLTPVLEEAEQKKLQFIRAKLNNLSIKKSNPKQRISKPENKTECVAVPGK